jgi:ABC-type polysaccharide transport system permease subunit
VDRKASRKILQALIMFPLSWRILPKFLLPVADEDKGIVNSEGMKFVKKCISTAIRSNERNIDF